MAVLQMKRVQICALKKDRKPVLELLQRLGVVEVTDADALKEDAVFAKQDRSNESATFRRAADAARGALGVLDRNAPAQKGLLSTLEGRRTLPLGEYEKLTAERDEILKTCIKLQTLEKQLNEDQAEIPKIESQMTSLEPWMDYDIPLNFSGTRKTEFFAGTLPGEVSHADLTARMNELAPDVIGIDANIVSTFPEQTCIYVVCAKKDAAAVQEALRKMNFARPPKTSVNPAEVLRELGKRRAGVQQNSEKIRTEIAALASDRGKIEFAADYYGMRAEKYDVIGRLAQSRRVFILNGYIPARNAAALEKLLCEKFDVDVAFSDPSENDDVPVLLQNNVFAEPVESVVENYSLPAKGEIDPSGLVAAFYYVLFGMMLSDAAYGIIIAVVCGICLKKFKNMELGLRKSLKMFFYCGISTTFFGFLYGSFFGNAVNVIASTFFNRPDIKFAALWFEPLNRPMKMLAFCFAVGILHLFVGLGTKLYLCLKSGRILDGIYDVVCWYMLVGGAIAYLLSLQQFTNLMGLTYTLSARAGEVAGIIALAGAVVIILTGGRESRNWFKRILKGLYSVYGITGYLSDILSYSRLLALGLATSVIATVFNKMGTMLGNSPVGVLMFIIVFLIGHSLNLAINALGAYVHTNRLQYVEFFGKFYTGGGRKFQPFTENTKYYKIREDNSL